MSIYEDVKQYSKDMRWWYKTGLHRYYKKMSNCHIELPNGAKCNSNFFWECVRLGILSEDD